MEAFIACLFFVIMFITGMLLYLSKSLKTDRCLVVSKKAEKVYGMNGYIHSKKITVLTVNSSELELIVMKHSDFEEIQVGARGSITYRGVFFRKFKVDTVQ
ncbi:DUF2500 domain-containing protein [Paenibacillus paridis]|uniref:DUF2500 domain-containing protein n=1 Tax=Paenibacillus paridis TaxID=2583376 RepID=UPI00111E600E|nr:DUF2500 domain-containing protein [Paenibacillus paridis]